MIEEYARVYQEQEGKCAICKTPFEGPDSALVHIDHDHESGEFRGLLCMLCNHLLGSARDNPDSLAEAIRYLDKHPEDWRSAR